MKLRMLSLFLALLLLLTTVCTAAAPEVSLFSTGDATAGHHLQGNDRIIYDALMPLINDIATGKRSSTILRVGALPNDKLNPKDYDLDAYAALHYSFEEELIGDTVYLNLVFDYNFNHIMDALVADCPYEMYWYDKTMPSQMITGYTIINGEYYPYLEFYFYVEQAYCDPETIESPNGRLYINTQLSAETVAIQETVLQIVEKYKNLDDYSKLESYRDEICSLVDYNHEAAGNVSTPYGDPWQLIYVFDGDKNTNVVCEGYSKAFQYLCDNTEFNSDKIQCYTVSGDMYALGPGVVGGGGGHMWNIVTMEDGKHYLVDVTNSDDGSIGRDGELFLTGTPITLAGTPITVPGAGGYTFPTSTHVFEVHGAKVIYQDDPYLDPEHGYWDDEVLSLAEHAYEYKPVTEISEDNILVEERKLKLSESLKSYETLYAVIYEDGKFVGIKAMHVGESSLDLSDFHGDEIKCFLVNNTSHAPLAESLQKVWTNP